MDIETEWESTEEEQTVVTRATEKEDEKRDTVMNKEDGKEEGGTRNAVEKEEEDKTGKMKGKGETARGCR